MESWLHIGKSLFTPSWCLFLLPYIILQQNCFEFRATFLRCKNWIPKWVTCLRISGEPIWHQLAAAAVYGKFLPFCSLPVVLGPEAGVECGCCAAHTSAFLCHSQTHFMSPKSSSWKPETWGLSLPGPHWLQVFLQHVTEISLDRCLCPAPATVKLASISFFLSLFLKKKSGHEWFLSSAKREKTNLGHSKEERINWKWSLGGCFFSNCKKALWNQVQKCKKENLGWRLSTYSLLGSWSSLVGACCALLLQSNGALGFCITKFFPWCLI